jgi:hypothetical protein
LGADAHFTPQARQLTVSSSFTHLPSQRSKPSAQAMSHFESMHTAAPLVTFGHALSHSPQLEGSAVRSRQTPSLPVTMHLVVLPRQVLAHLPSLHSSPVGQGLSQPPQWALLSDVSTHAPPQAAKPISQLAPHAPSTQIAMPLAGASQTVPQAPQFCASPFTSTQAAPHRSKPGLQVKPHSPSLQVALPFMGTGQAIPQKPQFSGLTSVSMHERLQLAKPSEQPSLHRDWSHTSTAEQLTSQPPQRAGSLETSTQLPEQSRKPSMHWMPQRPSTQVALPPAIDGQAWPQPPQFSTSDVTSLQLEPQAWYGAEQVNPHSESTQTPRPWGGGTHGVPQARQLFSSSSSVTHSPPHTVSPSRQLALLVPPPPPLPPGDRVPTGTHFRSFGSQT